MSYFSGCRYLLKLISKMFIFIMIISETSMAAEEDSNHFYEIWSREEMVQLAGYGEDKLSTVLITGTLLCKSCFPGDDQIRTWPLSGALVSINCNTSGERDKTYSTKVVTDEYGDFKIDVPSHLHGIPNLDKTCLVHVLRTPKKWACRPAFGRKQKILRLSWVRNGNRLYTAGEIMFRHLRSRPLHVCSNSRTSYKQFA